MKDTIITITGQIGSGKDHFANLLAGYVGRESRTKPAICRFADPLKWGIAAMFNYPREFLYSDENKALETPLVYNEDSNRKVTFGKFQQDFGDAMRDIDRDIFCKLLLNNIRNEHISDRKVVIVPDLRFPNEYDYLVRHKNNYKLILIRFIGTYVNKEDGRDSLHISETCMQQIPMEAFDYIYKIKTTDTESIVKERAKSILIENNIL